MILKGIGDIANSIFNPVMGEVQKAHEASIERIRGVLRKAEAEVIDNVKLMSGEQRVQAAEKEFAKAEEQMLSVVGSLFKSLLYLTLPVGLLIDKTSVGENATVEGAKGRANNHFARAGRVEKEIRGEVID